ncbi:MAG: 2-C-methyl-D-erythritol 2,4-cyclodiphosphate synthase [Actinomycetota bacterium]|nr:2-C-methyl-D-erythritol 2,4-cyclodiphosphate synthase [Actinomycetota bacterium]
MEIDYHLRLGGHSDADVLVHAVMDALLGAAGLADIGVHFPDSDIKYRGISSLKLLARVKQLILKNGLAVVNIDSTIIAQKPKLAPYIPQMKENMAGVLGLDTGAVGVKATTTEGLGFCGKELGIAAQSVALLT